MAVQKKIEDDYRIPAGKRPPSFTAPEWESELPDECAQDRRNREADYAKNNRNSGKF